MNESNQVGAHANESLRFVQLSDLHLSSISLPNPLRLANKRILGYLSWLRRRRHTHQRWVLDVALKTFQQLNIDHYAITGDLTHIGLKNEFEEVRQWLEQLGTPANVTVIPGNHDLYVNEKWSRSFQLWEPYLCGDDEQGSTFNPNENALDCLNQLYPTVRIRKNVAFICLNSIYDAPWFRATGRMHDASLERLRLILCNQTLNNYCKVVLVHHPITVTHTPSRKCLLNHQQLMSLLQQYPVDVVLHGHGHHTCLESIVCDNQVELPIVGMSSTSSISKKPGYQAEFLLFDICRQHQHWSVLKQSYTLDMKVKKFIANEPQQITTKRSYA